MAENYVGKCLFCSLGETSKRGVILNTRGSFDQNFRDIINGDPVYKEYICGLGDLGKDCVIPKLFSKLEYDISDLKATVKQNKFP